MDIKFIKTRNKIYHVMQLKCSGRIKAVLAIPQRKREGRASWHVSQSNVETKKALAGWRAFSKSNRKWFKGSDLHFEIFKRSHWWGQTFIFENALLERRLEGSQNTGRFIHTVALDKVKRIENCPRVVKMELKRDGMLAELYAKPNKQNLLMD